MNDDRLDGKVALVTGASSGMGFATAKRLAQMGAAVAIASRGGPKLEAAQRRLADEGHTVFAWGADLGELPDLEDLVDAVREGLGPIDILVANGGGPAAKAAVELDEADWTAAWARVFLFIPRLVRLVLPDMRTNAWGRIVAINSVSARQPIPNLALSNTLRPAVLGFLKTLSQEVGRDGITVNAILPGYTRTERQEQLANATAQRTGRSVPDVLETWVGSTALGRMAEPEETAALIGFLCSDEASAITGQAIAVDCGTLKGL